MVKPSDFAALYAAFEAPIMALDCGLKCAPYNHGIPYCCDTSHAVPSARHEEWTFLEPNTDLWHVWLGTDPTEAEQLREEAGSDTVLLECLGYEQCQRGFRTLVCRAFPFFPYFNGAGEMIGMSYYWDYEDRCWVISNLGKVSREYQTQFLHTYEAFFDLYPDERTTFIQNSEVMREVFTESEQEIPLLHKDGQIYAITPDSEEMRTIKPDDLPKYGPYEIADFLPFPDEE